MTASIAAILRAADQWGITHVTLLPGGRIASCCATKHDGASGPDLTDYVAAVLLGAAWVRWCVWQPWTGVEG